MIAVLKASTTLKGYCRPIKLVVYIYELYMSGAIFIFNNFMKLNVTFNTF